jgi:ferric-dicitrate binding protein FerR (iron transport regulator)
VNWDILLKYVNHEATEEEIQKVDNWLNENPENGFLLQYLERRRNELTTPLKQADIHQQWVRLLDRILNNQDGPNVKPFNWYLFSGIAASLLLFSLLGFYFLRAGQKQINQTYTLQTPFGQHGKVVLPDGTEVFMGPDSKLTYSGNYNAEKRNVTLKGEAFFNVKHNARKPFTVTAQNGLMVTVLGTSFNVYTAPQANAEVKVATGMVGVMFHHKTHLLKAGQEFTYLHDQKQVVVDKVSIKDAAALQSETLVFNDNNIAQIAQKISRWYNISVDVQPSAQKHAHFSGEMKDNGVENLLKGLSYATGVHYQIKDLHHILLF